jgi:hypothetical protein
MTTDEQFLAIISTLRGDQSDLRRELALYLARTTRVFAAPFNGLKDDITGKRIRQIKYEIKSKQCIIKALTDARERLLT